MTGFTGRIDRESTILNDFNQARLKRLQQVRQQEKALSTNRCDAYRSLIVRRKELKTRDVKRELIRGRKSLHDEFVTARQQSLIDNGYAHRTASDLSASGTINKIDAEELLALKREDALRREKVAMASTYLDQTVKRELAAALVKRNNLRRCAIASDREDARATAEAKAAKVARILDDQRHMSAVSILPRTPYDGTNVARQGGLRIQDRRPIYMRTNIVRHGQSNDDHDTIVNSAALQERCTMTRRWSYVMKEMIHRKSSASRAHDAYMNQKALHKLGQLEIELAALSLADKAANRANLASDAKAARLGPRREASQSSAAAFYSEFLAPSGTAPLVSIEESITSSSSDRSRPTAHKEPLQWSDGQLSERYDVRSCRTSRDSTDIDFEDKPSIKSTNAIRERGFDYMASQDSMNRSSLNVVEDITSIQDLSTSSAPTISARHDQNWRTNILSKPPYILGSQSSELDEMTQISDTSSFRAVAPKNDIRSLPGIDVEEIVDSTSLSGLGSISRSSAAYGRRPNDSISLSCRHSEDEGSSDFSGPLGLTVKMMTLPSSSSIPSNITGVNVQRKESFEAFFDELKEDKEDDDSFKPPTKAMPYTAASYGDMNGNSGSDSESIQSFQFNCLADGDIEADDNMSAITWPDMNHRKSGSLKNTPARMRRSLIKRDVTEVTISQSQASIEWNNVNQRIKSLYQMDDYSLQDDGFLQELDALSQFWTEKKKNSIISNDKNKLPV